MVPGLTCASLVSIYAEAFRALKMSDPARILLWFDRARRLEM